MSSIVVYRFIRKIWFPGSIYFVGPRIGDIFKRQGSRS